MQSNQSLSATQIDPDIIGWSEELRKVSMDVIKNIHNTAAFTETLGQFADLLSLSWLGRIKHTSYEQNKNYEYIRQTLDASLHLLEQFEEKKPEVKKPLKKGALVLAELIVEFDKREDDEEIKQVYDKPSRLLVKSDIIVSSEPTKDLTVLFKTLTNGAGQDSFQKCIQLVDECKKDARLSSEDEYEYRFCYVCTLFHIGEMYYFQQKKDLAIEYLRLAEKCAQSNLTVFQNSDDFQMILKNLTIRLLALGQKKLVLFVPPEFINTAPTDNKEAKEGKQPFNP